MPEGAIPAREDASEKLDGQHESNEQQAPAETDVDFEMKVTELKAKILAAGTINIEDTIELITLGEIKFISDGIERGAIANPEFSDEELIKRIKEEVSSFSERAVQKLISDEKHGTLFTMMDKIPAQYHAKIIDKAIEDSPGDVLDNFEKVKDKVDHFKFAKALIKHIHLFERGMEKLITFDLTPKQKQEIADLILEIPYKLKTFFKYFEYFKKDVDNLKCVIKIIAQGEVNILEQNLGKFTFEEKQQKKLDLLILLQSHNRINFKDHKFTPEEIAETVDAAIENGAGKIIAHRFYQVKDQVDHFQTAKKLAQKGVKELAPNLSSFELTNEEKREIADLLIEKGQIIPVITNISSFRSSMNRFKKEHINTIIEAGNGWFVAQEPEFFEEIDLAKTAKRLAEKGITDLAKNLPKFNLTSDQINEVADLLIANRAAGAVADFFKNFSEHVNHFSTIKKIAEKSPRELFSNLDKFRLTGEEKTEVSNIVSEKPYAAYEILNNSKTFEYLSPKVINRAVCSDFDITTFENFAEILEKAPEMNFLKNCNKDNALALLGIYASIDEERFPGFEKQRDLVKKAVAANKDIILEKLKSLRDTLLPPPEKGEKNGFYKPKTTITEDEKLLIPHIVKNGVEHYAIIEKTANFLDMVMKSEDPETHMQTQLALSKIAKYRSLDEKQERYKTADYREVDLSEFYEKSCSLQKTDAKVFLEFLRCFNAIQKDTENFKTMQNGPMMKIIVMLGLMQSAQKMDSENILESLKNLESKLKKSPNSRAQLEFIKEFDAECNNALSQLFESTLGLKNLPEINKNMIPHLTTHLTYLNNINEVDEFKKNIIAFFLVLHLTNQWQSFKKGENIQYEQYFEDKDVEKIKEYLGKRKDLDIFKEIEENETNKKWFETLEEPTEAQLLGDSRGIIDVVTQIEISYKNVLHDEDALLDIPDETTKEKVWKEIETYGEDLGQKELQQKTEELEKFLVPPEDIITIFQKVGEEMSTTSGVKALTEDVSYLRGLLLKFPDKLDEQEKNTATDYLDKIDAQITQLYQIIKQIQKSFETTSQKIKKMLDDSSVLKQRLNEYTKLFEVTEKQGMELLKSTMTGDIEAVIPEIRQCLACTSQGCNNDTNLTFGDRNRFLVLTKRAGSEEGSVADQLVTVQKTDENGKTQYSFVMDNVYGHNVRDTLIANTIAVIKKLKQIKKTNPEIDIDILLSSAALNSCHVDKDYLVEKLTKEGFTINAENCNRQVHIAQSASGDGHYEIGGGAHGRISLGTATISGISIR